MTYPYTIGGVRFLMTEEVSREEHGNFHDIDVAVSWVGDTVEPSGTRVNAPSDLSVWFQEDGQSIVLPDLHERTAVRTWQLRQIAPIVSAWFERLTLHASAVTINGSTIAFVGASEVGKSTLAWELVKAGATAVADDLACIRFTDTPSIALESKQLPLERICFLSRDGDTSLTPMDKVDALQAHLENGFGEHGDARVWGYQFDAYHRIVEDVPHYALTTTDDRERVGDTAKWLIDELQSSPLHR